jgi:hypothetical protein
MWYNPFMEWLLKSPMHPMLSGNMMVIHYEGKKSGKSYHHPVSYVKRNNTLLTVSYKQRTWWRNLRGGAAVKILLQGKLLPAHSQVIEDDQGVSLGLTDFMGGNPQAARMLGVYLNDDGLPMPESLTQCTKPRVIVQTTLD